MHRLVTFLPFLLVFTLLGTFVAVMLTYVIGIFNSPNGANIFFIFVIYPFALLIGSPFSLSTCIVFCIFTYKFRNALNQYFQNKLYSKAKLLGLYLGATSGLVIHTVSTMIHAIKQHFTQSKYLDESFLSMDLLNRFVREFIGLEILTIIVPSTVCGFFAIKLFGHKVLSRLA